VLRAARHAAELARFAAIRRSQEARDRQVLGELEARPPELPAGLEIEWLGVAGYRLTFEGRTLLIDPYVSRIPLRRFLRREPALPDRALVERYVRPPGEVVGVAVGHTHFDHALDVPEVARRFECPALGSRSLATLMRLHGLGDRAVDVEPSRPYELGPFTVTFVPSAHARIVLGLSVPMAGEMRARRLEELSARAYRCGQVWGIRIEVAGLRIYHQGSADLVDEALGHHPVDVFLAGVAGREFTPDYWRRILPQLEPRTVVPCHYDDFFRPLDAPMGFITNVSLARVPEEIAAESPDIEVVALPAPG